MAMPCSPGLRPQSDWIVFSAPEITTVSKPKRNPASAEVSDQKKMRLFIGESRSIVQRCRREKSEGREGSTSTPVVPPAHSRFVECASMIDLQRDFIYGTTLKISP